MDGGLTLNNPRVGERCLRVSPFFFDLRMQIRPRSLTPPWWSVVIPSMERAQRLFEQGRRDGERYLKLTLEGRSIRRGLPLSSFTHIGPKGRALLSSCAKVRARRAAP